MAYRVRAQSDEGQNLEMILADAQDDVQAQTQFIEWLKASPFFPYGYRILRLEPLSGVPRSA